MTFLCEKLKNIIVFVLFYHNHEANFSMQSYKKKNNKVKNENFIVPL